MGRPKEIGRIGQYHLGKGLKLILSTALVITLLFLIISPIATTTELSDDPEANRILRFTAQAVVMFVSFCVFFIQWLPPRQSKTTQTIVIASAFLATGIITFAHILTCSMLLNYLQTEESHAASFFHMMSGVTIAVCLLIASFIPIGRRTTRRESNLIFLLFLVYALSLIGVAALPGESFPSLCPHEEGADPTRLVIESGMIVAFVAATVKYHLLDRATKRVSFSYLACATLLGAYSHIAFTLHQSSYDLWSATSELVKIASFALVFVALFSGAVIQPYERLAMARKQAEWRRKEAEAATVKAQMYLDFLSHDVANMISPIMNRAEMILQSPDVSEKDREEALKIVEQTQKASSLIVNLRRLSSAEKVDLKTLGPVDLRTLFGDLEKSRRESHPEKDLRVSVRCPEEQDLWVLGGSVVEDIIGEIFDNAIKHSGKDVVRIGVRVSPGEGDPQRSYWNIEIEDDGPGIPDHTKEALDIASPDPKKRFTRGVASSLSVMPLIVEQLGGRIRIEDRVKGDYSQGTRVVLTLPKFVSAES